MDADGQNKKMLTNEGDDSPCWSLDGRKIVFDSYRDGWDNWQSIVVYLLPLATLLHPNAAFHFKEF